MNKPLTDSETYLKRLRYRSWHRGCKETDLILGKFADEQLSNISSDLLATYERILDENDADIWNWVVGKKAPEEYAELIEIFRRMVPAA